MKTIKQINEMVEELMLKVTREENYVHTWHDLCDITFELRAHEEIEKDSNSNKS